jgi:D-alanyl-D-alanine carboxypeptidase
MKYLFNFILLILILNSCAKNNSKHESKAQRIVDAFKSQVTDVGIVAMIDNGSFKDTACIGFAFDSVPVSTKNRFCIGSCTKMFTSVIVLKLQEKGLLNINDSVYHYIPKHPWIDSTITIKQLLNHTSGITEFLKHGLQNEPLLNPDGDFSNTVLYSKIDTMDFEKGTRYEYCNTNYFLLSKIIEKASDKSYEMNLQELIIEPLGLKNTFPYYSNTIEYLAHPMIDGQDLHTYPKLPTNVLTQGSGNVVCDVYDLNAFIRALIIDQTLLTPKSLDLMTSFYHYEKTKSGLGLFEKNEQNRILLGHTGRAISYITYAFADPGTGESFIVMNNNANDEVIDSVFEKLITKDDPVHGKNN